MSNITSDTVTTTSTEIVPIGNKPLVAIDSQQHLSPKAQVMKSITPDIPLTALGLPEYFYRADILPDNLDDFSVEDRMTYMEQAIVELDGSQGYPTLPSTDPYWGILPHEPQAAYQAFLAYIDLPRAAAQRLPVANHPLAKAKVSTIPVRQLHLLKTIVPELKDHLLDYYHTYMWASRIRAYDLFHVAHHNKLKEHRLMNAEDEHFGIASQFLEYATSFLEGVFTNPDEYDLKPKEAIDLMVKMIQVQRISAGATPFGSNQRDPNSIPKNASIEMISRNIVQQSGMGEILKDKVDPTKALLQDPDALFQAQELIIKMHGMAAGDRKGSSDFDDLDANINTNTQVIDQ